MELIKLTCVNEESRERAFAAAVKGLEYYVLALDHCYAQSD
jgi:hypothetical protein